MVRKSHAIPKQDRKKQVYDMMGNIRLQSQRDHKCQCPFCHAKVLFFLLVKYGFNLGLIPRLAQCLFLRSRFHFSFIKSHQITIFAVWLSVYLRHIYRSRPPDHSTFRRQTSATTPWYETVPSPPVFAARPNASWPPAPAHNGMPWDAMGCRGDKWWNQPFYGSYQRVIAYLHSTKT
jgi:hypothetical protein